eukprot:CAMPEP_0196804318 /NCGR_PEP_ID=MMETSP1362-20130617/3920_1 /TAXON_ID=163516 /ORGANISM="Leptocylindrus danicus, Strain CCMP1856" /LENGTH=280 /DNA_ID=CAMNT_0042176545 /DNA_START=146 /DNA_END=988 /DNA_ORIENTATION=+
MADRYKRKPLGNSNAKEYSFYDKVGKSSGVATVQGTNAPKARSDIEKSVYDMIDLLYRYHPKVPKPAILMKRELFELKVSGVEDDNVPTQTDKTHQEQKNALLGQVVVWLVESDLNHLIDVIKSLYVSFGYIDFGPKSKEAVEILEKKVATIRILQKRLETKDFDREIEQVDENLLTGDEVFAEAIKVLQEAIDREMSKEETRKKLPTAEYYDELYPQEKVWFLSMFYAPGKSRHYVEDLFNFERNAILPHHWEAASIHQQKFGAGMPNTDHYHYEDNSK